MEQNILVTCETAPNIALIKYWGKSDEELIIPLNGSISITLDSNVLSTKTSLLLLKETNLNEKKIQIWLNGQKQEFDELNEDKNIRKDLLNKKRFFKMLNKVRDNCSLTDSYSYHIRIASINNFPTACGLASSASGFACMALCMANAFKYNGDVSELARLGSGSACRSCFGGFVKWSAGKVSNESLAVNLFNHEHWPELNILALVLEDEKKIVSSTDGMETSTKTSDLLKYRVKLVEDERLNEMQSKIKDKNFNQMGKLAIRDSNCFHAVCMDTYPPLFYLNDKSKEIIRLVNAYNKFEQLEKDDLKVFYSFDAGPNAFLFILDKYLSEFIYLIYIFYFEKLNETDFSTKFLIKNKPFTDVFDSMNVKRKELIKEHFTKLNGFSFDNNLFIKNIIHSKVGKDPIVNFNNWSQSLLDKKGQLF